MKLQPSSSKYSAEESIQHGRGPSLLLCYLARDGLTAVQASPDLAAQQSQSPWVSSNEEQLIPLIPFESPELSHSVQGKGHLCCILLSGLYLPVAVHRGVSQLRGWCTGCTLLCSLESSTCQCRWELTWDSWICCEHLSTAIRADPRGWIPKPRPQNLHLPVFVHSQFSVGKFLWQSNQVHMEE